jgi:photosystem II stability/assembly factor-like uncharacterized protein
MRTFTISVIFLFGLVNWASWGQSGWTNKTPSGTYVDFTAIWAIDSDHIWAVGSGGTLIYSSNGGSSWEDINTGYSDDFHTVVFLNVDTGFISGDPVEGNAFLLRTVDGGANWQRINLPTNTNTHVNEIDFLYSESEDVYTLYATGGLGNVWKSQIPGDSWTQLAGGCGNGNFNSCSFVDENTGWFVGTPDASYDYSIMNTANGGTNFYEQTNPTERKLNGVSFINANKGIAVGLVATILYTENGGTAWENRPNSGYRWQSVHMTSSGRAWAVGDNGKIGYSTDYGYSWSMQNSDQNCELWEVHFINDNEGWIVGGGIGKPGVILHTLTGGIATDTDPEKLLNINSLAQNYPNPVVNDAQISYQIQSPGMVTITLYDALGNKLTDIVQSFQPAGNYKITFVNNNYPKGIYFYALKVDSELIQARKMLIMK